MDERFEELGVGRQVDPVPPEFKEQCSWVPASIWSHPHTGRTNIVYGGVNVQARINVLASNSAMHARTMQSAFSGNNQAFANRDAMLKAQGFQQHHIASNKNSWTKDHELFRLSGVDINSRVNTMYLPKSADLHQTRAVHLSRHTNTYSERVAHKMTAIADQGKAAGWTQEQYRSETRVLLSELRQELRAGNIGLNKHYRPWGTKW